MKPLVLVNNENNNYFADGIANHHFFFIFQNESILNRFYRKVILKTNTSFRNRLFRHWEYAVRECDTIILFDTGNAVSLLKYLKQRYPDKRIIFWYWNHVSRSIPAVKIKKCGVEMWSYDPGDCELYDMHWNRQFVFPNNYANQKEIEPEYDAFFIGIDKNRGIVLKEMAKTFSAFECSYQYYLVKSSTESDIQVKQEYAYQPPVTYKELVAMSQKSRVLIDIIDPDQLGLTLRPLECIYLKKKLITTMRHITDYELYHPDNVFIWNVDDTTRLHEFFNTPYDESNRLKLMQHYSVDSWFRGFELEK